jgi:hypothetical protein
MAIEESIPHTLLRSFTQLSDAEAAADRLKDAGIPSSNISIDTRIDEAGGTQGNFAVGNGIEPNPLTDTHLSTDSDYEKNFKPVKWQGAFLLLIRLDDDQQKEMASALLDGHGVDPEQALR